MAHDDQTYGGYENGQDWLDDLAIEDYLLKKGIEDDRPEPKTR